MTRSVEIPEEAVDAAQKAWTKAYWTEATPGKADWMRAALAAALPYLAPAVCTCPTDADVTPDMRTETGQHLAGCPLALYRAAPAVPQPADKRLVADRTGQNALAEWLEEVFSTGTEEGITWEAAAEALFECRAVRESAVPQPVDREALARFVAAIDAVEIGAGSEHYKHGRETMRDDAISAIQDLVSQSEQVAPE